MRFRVLFLVCGIFLAPVASAKVRFGVVGNLHFSQPQALANGNSLTTSSGLGYGGGFSFEIQPKKLKKAAFEIDLLYRVRNFDVNFGSGAESTKMTYVSLPILFRFYFSKKKVIGLGIGGFVEWGLGEVDRGGASSSFDDYGVNQLQWDAFASLRFNFALKKKIGVILDLRYSPGLLDLAIAENDEWKFRTYEVLLGVRFGKM